MEHSPQNPLPHRLIFAGLAGPLIRLGLLAMVAMSAVAHAASTPNILFIYLDDLGYGDLSTTNPDSKIPTPHIDRLATEGLSFSDAHAPASVCGPSRYGLLTGRYPWRRGKGGTGNGAKFRDLFMDEKRPTIASILQQAGYQTAQMGKWGLRHNYSDAVIPGGEPGDLNAYDFETKRLLGSQLVGFDYSWCITYLDATSSDIKVQFENGRPVDRSLSPTDPYRWLPDSANKVIEYLEVQAGKGDNLRFGIDRTQPFFIYWDPPSPHTPYVPNEEFIGRSEAGIYGDFVVEIDHYIGQILGKLDELGLAEDTLVIFASDNGPDSSAYERVQVFNHAGMHIRRGIKTDVFEGGHRTPLIVRWPGVVKPERQSSALVSFTDWFATIADITGQAIPAQAGEDSISFLPLLRDESAPAHRQSVVHHSTRSVYAIRQEGWIYIDGTASPLDEPEWFRTTRRVSQSDQLGQLYNLIDDPGQSQDLASVHPDRVAKLKSLLTTIKANP
jgi:arylsulfatase A